MNIKKITKKDGTIKYRTNVYLGIDSLTGKQVRTTATATTRKMCEIKANQAISNFIKNGSTVAREKVFFDDFNALAMSWFDSYKLAVKPNTIRVTNNYLKVYILPAIGSYKVEKINSILLQGIINQWAKNANTSPITNGRRVDSNSKNFKLLLNYIKRILDYGVSLGVIDSNPAINVIPPKLNVRNDKKIKYFDNEQLKRFLSYLDSLDSTPKNHGQSTMYRFLLATGLRVGECLALSWSDIDFNNETVSVSKTIVTTSDTGRIIQDSAKTKQSNRIVSIDKDTCKLLKSWKKAQSKVLLSIKDIPVFSYNGHSYTYANESQKLQTHLKNAQLPSIGFHGFRHTHASLLMNNDVNPKEIQERLGHADYSITMNTYSHLAKDKKKDTAEKFSNILKAL